MNFNSITTKISIVFLFAISMLIALFAFYINYDSKQKHFQIGNYHQNISNYLMEHRMRRSNVISYVHSLSFTLEENPFDVIPYAKVVIAKRGFETLEYKDSFYFHVRTPGFNVLFKDTTLYPKTYYFYGIFAGLFILLIVLYLWLIKSLHPLQELKSNISEFSKGNLNIDCKSDKKDEIADVANEFDNAVKKIELLLDSRQLFLRTVMHELKTPIAKGRIVSELVDDEKQKNRMITIFERLDFLINDFAKIEQVISKNYDLKTQTFTIKSLLDNAINLLMLENIEKKVEIDNLSDIELELDFDLISMVFKNLIDNALKYSNDSHVLIKEEVNALFFISSGNKLEKDIHEYFKPFHNEVKSKNHGMGLGLYIVKSILDLHNMGFEYEYKSGQNIFKIIYKG